MGFQTYNNTPSAGRISWSSVHMSYDGQTWAIADGDTALRYVYWLKANPSGFFCSDSQISVTQDDALVFINNSGVVINVLNESQIFGDAIVNGTIRGDAIAANSITANHIISGAITAEKINVQSLSAINANMGAITSGSLTIDQAGFVRGGQTAYRTGYGFWHGYTGGTYKMSYRGSSGTEFLFDGSGVSILDSQGTQVFSANGVTTSVPFSAVSGFPTSQYSNTEAAFAPVSLWEFQNSANGWAATSANITQGTDSITITPTAAGGRIYKTGLSIDGTVYSVLRARIRRISGTGWLGRVYFTTSGHSWSSYYCKDLNATVDGNWIVLEWKMDTLTVGGSDWINNVITGLRFDFGPSINDVFQVDWITVGKVSVPDPNVVSGSNPITSSNVGTYIATGAVTGTQIADASITNAKIGNVIQSSDYAPGTGGWKIDKTGAAEFNNIIMRSGSSGQRMEITQNCIKVYDSNGVLRVKLGDLSA